MPFIVKHLHFLLPYDDVLKHRILFLDGDIHYLIIFLSYTIESAKFIGGVRFALFGFFV